MFLLKSKSTKSVNSDHVVIRSNSAGVLTLLEKYSNLNLSGDSIDTVDTQRRGSGLSDITETDSEVASRPASSSSDLPSSTSTASSSIPNLSSSHPSLLLSPKSRGIPARDFTEKLHKKLRRINKQIYMVDSWQLGELLGYYYGEDNVMDEDLFPYLHGTHNAVQRIFFNKKFINCGNDVVDTNLYRELDTQHVPEVLLMHLMILNTQDSEFRLNNSIAFDELTSALDAPDETQLNNRNFREQLKLYADLSHFIVYNNSNNLTLNLTKAMQLKTSKFIYIVNFDSQQWSQVPAEYTNNSNFAAVDQMPINSINNQPFNCPLLKWEQNLLWKHNSMKWYLKNICLGNLIDYNYLSGAAHSFKLIVNCNEYATIPQVDSDATYIEFPSSGYVNLDLLNWADLINYLNVLKLIKLVVDRNQQVFIFSFDGFTGLSLLTLSVGLMTSSHNLEQLILHTYASQDLKFYFFKADLMFLKKFERFISYSKGVEGPIKFINYKELRPTVLCPALDWFDYSKDNNFPCKIFKNIYLGSVSQANSKTVVNCMKFNKIISIGERPLWLHYDSAPIHTYKNDGGDDINIYEWKGIDPDLPHLRTAIYIENLKDDGKDGIGELLRAPPHIQSKYLQNPSQPTKTFFHCKIGVSRSASLVIASLMKHQKLLLIESYMLVRIHRFNIIIQPNLRLLYDLYLYDGRGGRRYAWPHLCHEICRLNSNYIE